jgi:hypothetical protein
MQKTIRNLVLLLVTTTFFWGCENEVDIAADWKEIAVVYGAINPNQAKNYIRIQRAYLDEDQAAVTFSNSLDSVYFDSLDVTLEEFVNGSYSQTFSLRKFNGNDIGIEKDSGLFYSEDNFLYELSDPIKPSMFATDYQYKLVVRNPKTGYECRAMISSVGQAEIKGPVSNTGGTIYFSNESIPVTFQEGKHARAYKVEMDFRVREYPKDDPAQEQIVDYKWVLVNLGKTQSLRGFELGRYLVASSGFFSNLASVMPQDINMERRLVDFDLTFYGISDDFNTYLSVNKPSIGIVQKKPEFTNIENGIGLFASRNIASFENLSFHPSTIGLIQTNEKTKDLGFVQ